MTTFVGDQEVIIPGQTGIDTLAAGRFDYSATVIPRVAYTTVVQATRSDGEHTWFKLDSGYDIGDVVEIYQDLSWISLAGAISVLPPDGEDFGTTNSGTIVNSVAVGYGAHFRKLTSTTWGVYGTGNL